MRFRVVSVGVVALTVFSLGFGQKDVKTVRKAIEAQTAKFNAAFKARDAKVLESMMDDSFVSESTKGRMSPRAESLEILRDTLAAFKSISVAKSTILSLKIQNGLAIVKCDNVIKGVIIQPNGKKGNLASHTKSLEQWSYNKGVWKLHYARELPGGKTTIDGKVQKEN